MSDKPCRLSAKPVAALLLSGVLLAMPHTGMAQSAPDASPEGRRNPLKRIGPQPLTPEQREEAERLRKVAAKYGTDPTAIVGRMQLTSQYLDLTPHANATLSTARVDLPFRGDYLLRVEMPFLRTTDAQAPGMGSQRGLSDLSVVAGWRAYNTPEYALLVGAVGSFPTASEPAVGFGKYTVGPAIASARIFPCL